MMRFFLTLNILFFISSIAFAQTVPIIPLPQNVKTGKSAFALHQARLVVPTEEKARKVALFFAEAVREQTGLDLLKNKGSKQITFEYGKATEKPEGYRIVISSSAIKVTAKSDTGLFWAVQSLRQFLPIEKAENVNLPALEINDHPQYSLRSNMLDVSRHFFSVGFIKKHLDLLSYYKINTFHWHLTDDQGWRIEIKKYPKLTTMGAWRTEADGSRHGGFYTQEEVKEVVRYAADRYISVIPEIEMPGHAVAALAAYPELSCTKQQFKVPFYFGVHKEVFCAGQDKTYAFLQDVLNEVMPLFPSKYLHIGGDEVPKDRWHKCPVCQQKIKEEGLKDEHGLQSYFVKRMQKFLQSKGKTMIGWDEIMEGGVDSSAIIEVWRGQEKAKEAVGNGNKIIQTVYFDGPPESLTLKKTFDHNPAVAGAEMKVLGSDSPVWTEYITELNGQYMIYPRMQAFAEALWNGTSEFNDFKTRLQHHYQLMNKWGIAYGAEDRNLLTARLKYLPTEKVWRLYAQTGLKEIKTHYAFGDENITAASPSFNDSLTIKSPVKVNVVPFRDKKQTLTPVLFHLVDHKAVGKLTVFNTPYQEKYKEVGDFGLTDGLTGSLNYGDGSWLGWSGNDMDVTVDMVTQTSFESIKINFLQNTQTWILLPVKVDFYISDDAKKWKLVKSQTHKVSGEDYTPQKHEFSFKTDKTLKARFIKVIATAHGKLPEWHTSAGGEGWIFADEIIVE